MGDGDGGGGDGVGGDGVGGDGESWLASPSFVQSAVQPLGKLDINGLMEL